ncbi:hypothetical protein HX001_05940 [Empedobacter brevis]|uniref:Uncharacterized protein n=1 Tax=Empedobacter brevis TaxID=247 RepID=A0AAJ1V764_9FLAO|nr:hypothetical protein [Empedobacter brevis]MDM1072034.1 hypothetical protein [Empedobacter brevis]
MEHNFNTKSISFVDKKSNNSISFQQLTKLFSDYNDDYLNDILNRFNPDGLDFNINIENVDIAFDAVNKVLSKYEFINHLCNGENLKTFILADENEDLEGKAKDFYFQFNDHEESPINAKAIYNSKDQFYDVIKLANHINYLRKNGMNKELQEINAIWLTKSKLFKERKFKLLKSKNSLWFLRAVNSSKFKEYGTAFTFVYTILLLNEYENNNKGNNFKIESLDLNESKISMVISQGVMKKLGEIGFLKSSIEMTNNDLGKESFVFTQKITLYSKDNSDINFPLNFKKQNAKTVAIRVSHQTGIKTLDEKFSTLFNEFTSIDEFEKEYLEFLKTKDPKGLFSAIIQKISNSPTLRNCNEIKDLFLPKTNLIVDNLSKLINICGKADQLDIDYDLKYKVREIISEVLIIK